MSGFNRLKRAALKYGSRVRRSRWAMPLLLALTACGFLWRTVLVRTRFIAITGSFGKTTAKECLAAILSRSSRTSKTNRNANAKFAITKTILAVRPWHAFAVVEAGTGGSGMLVRASLLVRPQVVVVLGVGQSHTQAFRTLNNTAAEKSKLLRFMSRRGTAVLNGDDERVAAMASLARGSVLTFGTKPDHDVWADNIRSRWPDRLSFTVHTNDETAAVQTRLVGKHWAPAVLGAIGAARVSGLPLAEAAVGLSQVEPFYGRMDPRTLPGGAVILRDDFNGSIASFEAAIEVLREALATQRVLVIGDCSDFRKKPRERIKYYAKLAREAAEVVVFIGERCDYGVRRAIREGFSENTALGFFDWTEAANWLGTNLTAGGLALLRGTHKQHLARLYFRLIGDVECEQPNCRLRCSCDECDLLGFKPHGQAESQLSSTGLRRSE